MAEIDEIKILYEELQGYLSQTPIPGSAHENFPARSLSCWINVNKIITELEKFTKIDLSRFKITSVPGVQVDIIYWTDYRQKLNGLINWLYAKYFSDKDKPFSGGPSTVIQQSQSQSQSQHQIVQMLLDVQSVIDKNLPMQGEGSPQKTFLEKLKQSLSGVRSVVDLLSLVFSIAKDCGIGIDQISKLLS